MTAPRHSREVRRRAVLTTTVLSTLLALVGLIGITWSPTAQAEDEGELTIAKTASATDVNPGDTFTYTITVTCTNIGSGGCTNANVTDSLPEGISLDPGPGAISVTGATGTATATADGFRVDFTNAETDPPGSQGLLPGATATITVPVRVDDDIDPSLDGQPLVNTATADADNAVPVDDSATVTPHIPINLAASTAKSFDPDSALANPGTETTMSLSGGNDSNVPVDEVTITDPLDPPNDAFTYLALTGAPTVTLPDGAEQVQVDAYVDGAWVEGAPGPPPAVLPTGVDPADVQGIRIHFISTDGANIAPDASGSVEVPMEQRDNITDAGTGPLGNEVSTTVTREGETSDPATADADYTVLSAEIDLAAAKSFDPDVIAAGGDSTVTIGATNTSDRALDTLRITEPGADPNMFENGLTFDGWADGIVWPAGATGASVTYTYADGSTETLEAGAPDTLPDPDPSKTVTGFTIEFTGDISPGAEATIPYTVTADPTQSPDEIDHPNTIEADSTAPGGYHGHATAEDTLTTVVRRINVETDKTVHPAEIYSIPGQTALVELSGRVTDFPDSTADANDIIVQDPADPDTDTWYDYFSPTGVIETPIPANSTLTVEYYNGTEWVPVPGMEDIPGPDTFTGDFPPEVVENAQGIRFDYHSDAGFPPGTEVNPNINFELKPSAAGQDIDVEDCADTRGVSAPPDVPDATSDPVCRNIHIQPLTPGDGDIIDKAWDAPKAVGERTEEEAGATISWSTSGASNIDQMVISDVPTPSAAALGNTVFDSFDLVRIDPITAAQDPWLTYDQVTEVELYSLSQDAWIEAPNDPCPAACDGTFPGYTLSAASQADTIGFRLTYAESPTRADRINGNPEAPPVGSGVARSSGNDRQIHPVFQIRDELRSNPQDPVLAEDVYNTGTAGEVRNDARATVVVDGAEYAHQDVSDIIDITPVNVTANLTKDWTGGPLGVPEPGTADFPDEYPTGRVHLAAENTTPRKVDSLTIREPLAPTDPFDVFNLRGFTEITAPGDIGATEVTITLDLAGGGTQTMTRDEALGAAESDLTDVVGFTVTYAGRILSEGVANVVFDTRLRPTHRSDGTNVTAAADSPVDDLASATASDLDDYPGVDPRTNTDTDAAEIVLQPQGIGLNVTKDISPASQTEPDDSPVTVTLTGQPTGPTRTNRMQLTDSDATFFNAYDFVGFGAFTFTDPIDRVQVDAYVGGTFTVAGGDVTVTGGDWVEGIAGTTLTLPAGVTADQVQGLRFTFTRADGSIWENPATPTQTVLLQVQRRTDLRSGGPVTSDLQGNDPMPGESAPGVSTDTVEGRNWAADTVNGEPLTASDDATDDILYRHSRNAVQVDKTPSGAQPPAQDIPYALTFTNTGDTPITDPVITDRIPSDADGPLLVKDPDLPAGDSGYTYALAGDAPDPPNGPAMPTDAAGTAGQVSVDETPTLLTFTFPAGTVLEVGQTYTITTALQFRTGLPGNTEVTNTTGITGDRAWDDCSQSLDPDTGECQASTTVYPIRAGALKGVKMVKADDDQLGVLNTRDDPNGCQPNDQGFYVGGCVPVTKPGQTDTWRMQFTNTGNLPQDKVYAIDRLPTPGDTGAITSLERGSQWTPTPQTLTFAGATDGTVSEIRVYYDTDQDLCTDDLDRIAGCPDGEWTEVGTIDPTVGSSIDLPADATAIKVETDFADDMLEPTGTLSYDVVTRAPAQSETTGSDTIAWNTVAAAAETDDGGAKGLAPKSEGNKVGAALATGPLEIQKLVRGDGAGFAPTQFTLRVTCTDVDGDPVDLDGDPVTLTAGEVTRIDDLPYGATCSVAEDDTAGATHFSANTVTVGYGEDAVRIVAVNAYDVGSMSVTKAVDDGGAVDQDDNPITYGPFQVAVACEFLGVPVYADGYGVDNPMTAEIDDGVTVTFNGLPTGATCTTTEPGSADAASTTITPEQVTIPDGTAGAPVQDVNVTNHYTVGSLHLRKFVPRAARPYAISRGPFTLHVSCTLTDASHPDGTVVYDDDVVLEGGQPLETEIDNIATGAVCQVTEPDPGAATVHLITPRQVSIGTGNDHPVDVVVTNLFGKGALTVTKVRTGAGADLYGAGPFQVSVTCTYTDVDGDQQPLKTPGGDTRQLSADNDYTATYDPLLLGSTCHIEETRTGGATDSVITDADGNEVSDVVIRPTVDTDELTIEPIQLQVTNTFDVGKVVVRKVVKGPGSGPYTVGIACTHDVDGTTTEVEIPGGAERTLSARNHLRTVYDDLPVGAVCQVTEPDDGGADHTTISPSRLTVGADKVATVMVTNVFDVGPDDAHHNNTGNSTGNSTSSNTGLSPSTGPESQTGGAVLDDHRWLLFGAMSSLVLALASGVALWRRRRS